MANQNSATTVNGKKVYPKANIVESFGRRGASRESPPKAGQVSNLNGKSYSVARHIAKPGQQGNGSIATKTQGATESTADTRGATAEESRKRLAGRMYPSSTGSRFA